MDIQSSSIVLSQLGYFFISCSHVGKSNRRRISPSSTNDEHSGRTSARRTANPCTKITSCKFEYTTRSHGRSRAFARRWRGVSWTFSQWSTMSRALVNKCNSSSGSFKQILLLVIYSGMNWNTLHIARRLRCPQGSRLACVAYWLLYTMRTCNAYRLLSLVHNRPPGAAC